MLCFYLEISPYRASEIAQLDSILLCHECNPDLSSVPMALKGALELWSLFTFSGSLKGKKKERRKEERKEGR